MTFFSKNKKPTLLKDILIRSSPLSPQKTLAEEKSSFVREDILKYLQDAWEELVGSRFSKKSRPIRLREKQLLVGVERSTWAQELGFEKEKILEKIRLRFPHISLEEIRIQISLR